MNLTMMINRSILFLITCIFFIVSCSSPDISELPIIPDPPIIQPPNPPTPPTETSISLQVNFTIADYIYSRSMVFSSQEPKLNNVWIVGTNVVDEAKIFFKQELIAKENIYSATLDRASIAGDNCRLYFIGNADLIPNLNEINSLDELRAVRVSEALEQFGVTQDRQVVATQQGIIPFESDGSIVIKDVELHNSLACIQLEYQNKIEKIESITISGTSKYGTLRSFFDADPVSNITSDSFVINDNAPGMGGATGKVGLGYYNVNPNGTNPISIKITIAGQNHNINFEEIKIGYTYSVTVRHGCLLGYNTTSNITYSNGNFTLPSDEVFIDLTCEQGSSFSSDASWLEFEEVKSRTGGILIETKKLRCHANKSLQFRSGKITIRNNNNNIEVLTFTQNSEDSNVAGIEFVRIPAGTFIMGSPATEFNRDDDETQHTVTLTKAFSMGKYEVTNAQFCLFLNSQGVTSNGLSVDNKVILRNPDNKNIQYIADSWTTVSGRENHPVVHVTWFGAAEFASWAGGTLPTEAQWEYACRGDYSNKGSLRTTSPFGVGNGYELNKSTALFFWTYSYNQTNGEYVESNITAPTTTQTVGNYSSSINNYGLSDMHGNVWEWCNDLYSPTYGSVNPATSVVDPAGAQIGVSRVMRGGSWYYYARSCRSAFRMSAVEDTSSDNVGFRIVRQ